MLHNVQGEVDERLTEQMTDLAVQVLYFKHPYRAT